MFYIVNIHWNYFSRGNYTVKYRVEYIFVCGMHINKVSINTKIALNSVNVIVH